MEEEILLWKTKLSKLTEEYLNVKTQYELNKKQQPGPSSQNLFTNNQMECYFPLEIISANEDLDSFKSSFLTCILSFLFDSERFLEFKSSYQRKRISAG